MQKRPYPRHQRRHDAILLAMLGNPAQKQKDIAKATGYPVSSLAQFGFEKHIFGTG
jgi:hypothetical protein